MTSATQYADWWVEHCAKEIGAPIDPMSLEKHLYYAQSFSLAVRARPLFGDDFEAWKFGPVIRGVWKRYRGAAPIAGRRTHLLQFSPPPVIEPEEKTREFLSNVIAFLSRLTTFELSNATHTEDPWRLTRGELGPSDSCSRVISKESMQLYYGTLIEEGENALSRQALLSNLPSPSWGWMYVAGICARGMVTHPYYFHGLSLWGAKSKLWEKPEGEFAANLYPQPPKKRARRPELQSVSTVEEVRAEFQRQT